MENIISKKFSWNSTKTLANSLYETCLQDIMVVVFQDDEVHHLGLNICFDEYNYHDFLQEELAIRLYALDCCEMIDDSAFGVINLVDS